jgi:hypothetical protein
MQAGSRELTAATRGGHAARRWAVRLTVLAAGALVASELAVRALGLTDFPVYVVDPQVGYYYRADQRGRFLNRNSWAVNARGMPTGKPWAPDRALDIVVIGNSIVAGGNPYEQRERLAPLLERLAGEHYDVWPVAAGGWSTVNEVAYLGMVPDVVATADLFVWSHVAGGLTKPNHWLGDAIFPRERPRWATGYVLRRYLLPRLGVGPAPPPSGEAVFDPEQAGSGGAPPYATNLARWEQAVARLAQASGRRMPGIVLLYPTREQLDAARRGLEWLPERTDIERVAAAHGLLVVDLTRSPEWSARQYKDDIHPTPDGNLVLARILLSHVRRALEE